MIKCRCIDFGNRFAKWPNDRIASLVIPLHCAIMSCRHDNACVNIQFASILKTRARRMQKPLANWSLMTCRIDVNWMNVCHATQMTNQLRTQTIKHFRAPTASLHCYGFLFTFVRLSPVDAAITIIITHRHTPLLCSVSLYSSIRPSWLWPQQCVISIHESRNII